MLDYQAIGQRIRTTRKKRNMTQVDLGKAVGLSTSFIGHVERGSRKASLETMHHIAEALDASLDVLLTGSMRLDEECLSLARRRQTLADLLRVLEEHADEWMPAMRRIPGD